MKESLKDIKKITSQIYPPAGAERIASELYDADNKLQGKFPDVGPNKLLIEAIKADVAGQLKSQKQKRVWGLRIAAVAASIAILCGFVVKFYVPNQDDTPVESGTVAVVKSNIQPEVVTMSWDQNDELTLLSAKLDNIETAFYENDDDSFDGDTLLIEVESQVTELKGLFWKG